MGITGARSTRSEQAHMLPALVEDIGGQRVAEQHVGEKPASSLAMVRANRTKHVVRPMLKKQNMKTQRHNRLIRLAATRSTGHMHVAFETTMGRRYPPVRAVCRYCLSRSRLARRWPCQSQP